MRYKNLLIKFDRGLVGKERFLRLFRSVINDLPLEVTKKLSRKNICFYLTRLIIYSPPPFTNYFIGKKSTENLPKSTVVTGGGIAKIKNFRMRAVCFYSDYVDAFEDSIVRYLIAHEIAHLCLKRPHTEDEADDQVKRWGFKKEWLAIRHRDRNALNR